MIFHIVLCINVSKEMAIHNQNLPNAETLAEKNVANRAIKTLMMEWIADTGMVRVF
jgi:hypothetical protein